MSEYLFLGPSEKYFDAKKGNKVKKLVKYLLDFTFDKRGDYPYPLQIGIKPNTGFNSYVAEGLIEYKEENPDKRFWFRLITEFNTDFKELPPKTQELFEKLYSYTDNPKKFVVPYFSIKGKQKAQYGMMAAFGSCVVYYYDDKARKDKVLAGEYYHFENKSRLINFAENLDGRTYSNGSIRKRASSIAYAYRVNVKLPNGDRLTGEKANFVSVEHAEYARRKFIKDSLWQEIEDNELSFGEVAREYIETKKGQKSLYIKYNQFYNSFIKDEQTEYEKIIDFGNDNIMSSSILQFMIHNEPDGRRINLDGSRATKDNHLSEKYINEYYAFISNVFDYAYLKGYINYQPMYIHSLEYELPARMRDTWVE